MFYFLSQNNLNYFQKRLEFLHSANTLLNKPINSNTKFSQRQRLLFSLFILLFIFTPLIEIYLLIQIGSEIGALPTIALCLFTAGLGVTLLRIQGFITLSKIRHSLDLGELPAATMLEGLMLLIAGALLLTPGFFTDAIGFICLVPSIRSKIANSVLKRAIVTQHNKRAQTSGHGERITIEGEFWEHKEP
jgi:UPF0716 protein FxsA